MEGRKALSSPELPFPDWTNRVTVSQDSLPTAAATPAGPVAIIGADEIRLVDRELLLEMRSGDAFGIGELTDAMGVTATAVRQRIERLLTGGLLDREKVVAGRGRPTYHYRLTQAGHRVAGADPTELANALWQVILEIEDPNLRTAMLQSVAEKLGRHYASALAVFRGTNHHSSPIDDSDKADSEGDDSLQIRLQQLAAIMSASQIATSVSQVDDLPVLDICACPYPTLTSDSNDREMCRLEEQMLSEALGRSIHLCSCRLDGDACCQFAVATP